MFENYSHIKGLEWCWTQLTANLSQLPVSLILGDLQGKRANFEKNTQNPLRYSHSFSGLSSFSLCTGTGNLSPTTAFGSSAEY